MGWFGTSNDATNSKGKPTDDGGFIAPDRSARALCWQGRDAFFKCLDQHDIIDSVRQDAQARKACPKELAMFENACVDSWVTYFKKRRVMEHQRDQTLKRLEGQGATSIDTSGSTKPA